jgi:hypothetical protein
VVIKYILQGGLSDTPTADSRIAVHDLADRNALRNPKRQLTICVAFSETDRIMKEIEKIEIE